MFQAGGTDVFLHKYLGANTAQENATADQPHYATTAVTNIQDLLFLENRDRKYDSSIYRIRGFYNVQNIDFNLSQFGLFIDNDTLYMTVHINDFISYVGRKPISGDVLELPHLKDNFTLDDHDFGMPRYYVIEDVGRASEGFSATWYPHLYRLRVKRITDSQQFADILNKPALDSNGDPVSDGTTLRDLISTHNTELAVNDVIVAQAEVDAPKSGYETRQFYTLAVDPTTGKTVLNTADTLSLDASVTSTTALESAARPVRTGYTGYLVGDGFPQNGYDFGHGIQFPDNPGQDDFFLRTDFMPNRLFRFDGTRWAKVEDAVRMNMTNNDTRSTLKTGFINNDAFIYNDIVKSDFVTLSRGDYVIDTNIDYTVTAPFLEFKLSTVVFGYQLSSYTPSLISNNGGKIRITLPVINLEQQVIPEDGSWRISMCNNREAQRQSLSKALRPKADL
jgi:hypothetical protein